MIYRAAAQGAALIIRGAPVAPVIGLTPYFVD